MNRDTALAVVTADRPDSLKKCLISYIADLRRASLSIVIAVFDDSRNPISVDGNAKTIAEVGRGSGLAIFHVGRNTKLGLIDYLSANGVPPRVSSFALFGTDKNASTTGANRNAALLFLAGSRILSSDDDVICTPHALLESLSPEKLRAPDGWETFFINDLDSAFKYVKPVDISCFALADQYLSMDATPVGPSTPMPERIRSNRALGKSQHIVATLCGTIGDSGMPTGASLMASDGANRLRFLADEASYRRNRMTCATVRMVPKVVIGSSELVSTTTLTGFSNKQILPPFSPNYRGQDSLFGITVAQIYPEGLIGLMPVGLLHDPQRQRQYDPLPLHFGQARAVSAVVRAVQVPSHLLATDRMTTLGLSLKKIASQSTDSFRAQFLSLLNRQATLELHQLEKLLLVNQRTPAYWAKDMSEWINSVKQNISHSSLFRPAECQACGADALDVMQEYLKEFGDLLAWWPTIVGLARERDPLRHHEN
jgi:hypothetical protein